ncbi:hypothetical protein BDR22DRAFT_890097 [Usnea florida]
MYKTVLLEFRSIEPIFFRPWTIVLTIFIGSVTVLGLDFPREYPSLDIDRSTSDCRRAWHSLTSVPCHERIWTRDWDYGQDNVSVSDLSHYLPSICEPDCTDALNEAQILISNSCDAYDKFNLDGYEGRFNTTLLEPNPVDVMDVLVARQTHDCRKSPIGDADGGYCLIDLQERWGILDGLMVEPLHGIDDFLNKTNQYKVKSVTQMLDMSGGLDYLDRYQHLREQKRFGPGPGETTCSYCTLDWLSGKMKRWKPDLVHYEDGSPMGLPVYMLRMGKAGRRCDGQNFAKMWAEAMELYEEQGLLDREGRWLRQPSGDSLYLFQHGPSAGDSPLPQIRDYLEQMADWKSKHWNLPEYEEIELNKITSCLQGLHEEIFSMTCYPFLSKQDLASNILDTPEHSRSSCTNHCKASIQRLRVKTHEACPKLTSDWKGGWTLRTGVPFSLYEWRNMIFSKHGSLARAEEACGWN